MLFKENYIKGSVLCKIEPAFCKADSIFILFQSIGGEQYKKYITVKKYEKENAALKEENAVLKSEAAEKDNQLSAVNMELSESKSLLKTLQHKLDKVMKFIEQQRLYKHISPCKTIASRTSSF